MLLNEAELLICKVVNSESSPKKGWFVIATIDPAGNQVIHDAFSRHELYLEVNRLFSIHGEILLNEIKNRFPKKGSKSIFINQIQAKDKETAIGLAKELLRNMQSP